MREGREAGRQPDLEITSAAVDEEASLLRSAARDGRKVGKLLIGACGRRLDDKVPAGNPRGNLLDMML
jgi:hypothetical protein